MDLKKLTYTNSETILNFNKGGNPGIVKWYNSDTERSHLYELSIIVKLIGAKRKMLVSRDWGKAEMGKWSSEDTNFQLF